MSEEEIAKRVVARLGGWIEHDGQKCPVPDNAMVMCQLKRETRDHAEAFGPIFAKYLGWDSPRESTECIVAYKVVRYD